MNAKIITIGDEILIGQIVDTNSAFIASHLNSTGITVADIESISDTEEIIHRSLEEAINNYDLTIVTGGLGPTKDDITKRTLAAIFGCKMIEDKNTRDHVEQMLMRRGVAFNELNRSQADVPEACSVITNHNGTAPGMWFERKGKILISLPGVPFEMKELMVSEVIPRIRTAFHTDNIIHKTLNTFGIAESMLAEKLERWENDLPQYLRLAYLPSPSGVKLRLSYYGKGSNEAMDIIDRKFGELASIIPANIVGFEDNDLLRTTTELLKKGGYTIAVAESCTGGSLSASLTSMPGSSQYFMSGVVSYSNESKTGILKVNPEDISNYGAVSQQVSEQMASGMRRLAGTDFALSTTGIAGPTGGTADKPVGTVWISLAHAQGVISRKFNFGNLREQNISRAVSNALNMLRLHLIDAGENHIGTL